MIFFSFLLFLFSLYCLSNSSLISLLSLSWKDHSWPTWRWNRFLVRRSPWTGRLEKYGTRELPSKGVFVAARLRRSGDCPSIALWCTYSNAITFIPLYSILSNPKSTHPFKLHFIPHPDQCLEFVVDIFDNKGVISRHILHDEEHTVPSIYPFLLGIHMENRKRRILLGRESGSRSQSKRDV